MEKPNKKLPEQSKSKNSDVRTMKGGSKTTSFEGSVENSKVNGVRVSTNGNEDLAADNLEGVVVAMAKTKVVETETEVNDEGYSENVHDSDSFYDGENEVAGDGIGATDGISLLVDVSSEMEREDSSDFYERENGGSLNEKRGNPDGKMTEMSDSEDGVEEDSSDGEYEFCVGDFVWGKIKSHPWWPGQVYDSSDASDYALKVKRRDRILVAYFDGTFAWCHPSQLKPFEKNFEELSKQSSSKNFDNAVQKAVDEIGRLVELKMTCSCVPDLVGLARPLSMNSGIKPGVLVPEGRIAKLWNYLFGPAKCLTVLKQVARVASINNRLEFMELKCWLSAFYHVSRHRRLTLYHDPESIPGLEDNNQSWVLDSSHDAEFPIQGPIEEETNQSLLQMGLGDSENGQYQKRKQKSIAEIMEGYVDTQVKNVEDVMNEGTGLADSAPLSWRKRRKGNDEANSGSNSSSKTKRRKVTKLLESTLATGSEIPSTEREGSSAKEEAKKVLLSREKKKNKGSLNESDTRGKEETKTPSIERTTVQRNDGEAKEQAEKGFLSRERKKSKYLSPPFTSINRRQSKKGIEAESLKVSSEPQLTEQMTRAAVNLIGSESHPTLMGSDEVLQKKDAKDVGEDHEKSNNSSPKTQELDQNTTINTMKVKTSPNEVLSGIRCTAIDLSSLEENNSLDAVEGFLSVFRSCVYCNGSNYKMYNKNEPGRKRKTLDSEHGSSAKDQSQTDQKSSPEQRSRQTKMKKNEEAKMRDDSKKLDKPVLKQAAQTPEMKTKDRETHGNEKLDKLKLKPAARTPYRKTRYRETDGKGKSDELKLKPGARSQDKKGKDKETDGKAAPVIIANDMGTQGKASPPSLFVTFGPGSSLPSKTDLIKIYSKFGSLNEEETEVFYNNFCARVVFLRSSDAEAAFESSQLASPFRASNTNFQLRNSSSSSKVRKLKEISNAKPFPAKELGKTLERDSASKSSVGEASLFNYVKQKLEMIASVLENSDGKMSPELKSKLESDVKDLLEQVKTVAGSSSS